MPQLRCGAWLLVGLSLCRMSVLCESWTANHQQPSLGHPTGNAVPNVLPRGLSRRFSSACTMIHPVTQGIIDLNRLTRVTGTDYIVIDEESGDVFKINVCRAVLTETWGIERADRVGIYREQNRERGESLGSWNDTLRPHGTSAAIFYGEGSPCKAHPGQHMGSIISFECANDVWHTGSPLFAGSIDGCQYFFTWRTSFACASLTQRSLRHSMGMVLVAGFVIFLVYFVLFCSYRRIHLNLRGRDQFPSPLSDFGTVLSTIRAKLTALLFGIFHNQRSPARADGQGGTWTPVSARAWWQQNHSSSAYANPDNQHKSRSPAVGWQESEGAELRAQCEHSMNEFFVDCEDQRSGLINHVDEWDEVYSSSFPSDESPSVPTVPLITRTDVDNKTEHVSY